MYRPRWRQTSAADPAFQCAAGGAAFLCLGCGPQGRDRTATAKLASDAIATGQERGVSMLILRINTAGGLATNRRESVAENLASPMSMMGFVRRRGPTPPVRARTSSMQRIWRRWHLVATWLPQRRCSGAMAFPTLATGRERPGKKEKVGQGTGAAQPLEPVKASALRRGAARCCTQSYPVVSPIPMDVLAKLKG
jgi:hypothetical protein